jgi:hypothetical protein
VCGNLIFKTRSREVNHGSHQPNNHNHNHNKHAAISH